MDDKYIAGLFDGEGSVGIYRITNGKRLASGKIAPSAEIVYWTARLSISGTYRPMIEEVAKYMPGASFIGDIRKKDHKTPGKTYSQGQCRPGFKAQIQCRAQVVAFLKRIRPYLWEKAEQVDIVLKWANGELDGETASNMCKEAKRFKFEAEGIKTVKKVRQDSGAGAYQSKLTQEQVDDIRKRAAEGERQVDLAEEYGVNRQMINKVVHGKTYKVKHTV